MAKDKSKTRKPMAKKAKPVKKAAKKNAKPRPVLAKVDATTSVSVRKISNGFLISESRETKRGFSNTETFSKTMPKIAVT